MCSDSTWYAWVLAWSDVTSICVKSKNRKKYPDFLFNCLKLKIQSLSLIFLIHCDSFDKRFISHCFLKLICMLLCKNVFTFVSRTENLVEKLALLQIFIILQALKYIIGRKCHWKISFISPNSVGSVSVFACILPPRALCYKVQVTSEALSVWNCCSLRALTFIKPTKC